MLDLEENKLTLILITVIGRCFLAFYNEKHSTPTEYPNRIVLYLEHLEL